MRAVVPLVLAAVAACAPSEPIRTEATTTDPTQCFYATDVSGFRAPADRTIYVGTARGETYRVDTSIDCREARSAAAVGFDTLGTGRVCTNRDLVLVVPDARFPRRCPVSALTRLSDAETAALPAEARP